MAESVCFEAMNVPSCGLDVHNDFIVACVLDEKGGINIKEFSTMRRTLYELKDWILSFGCLTVLMESTGIYWMPIYEILEEVEGMDVGVGNSTIMKQVPGRRKTDKDDAKWVSKLSMFGLILKSFVVKRKFRELKEYTRYHKKLVQDRARHINRIEKLLQMNGFKLSSVLSSIVGASGRRLLKKLQVHGSVSLKDVRAVLDKNVKKTPEEIESAVNGKMKKTSRWLLGRMLSKLDAQDKEIEEIYNAMCILAQHYETEVKIIDSIPGIGEQSAIYLLAEISNDLSSFESAGHLTSWAGLAPKENESAGKRKPSKTKKGNIYVKTILTECALAAVRTKNTRISNWYWSNVKRIGKQKAIIGAARKLLVYIYAMLKNGELYDDSLDAADNERRKAEKLDSAHKTLVHHLKVANIKNNIAAKQNNSTNADATSNDNTVVCSLLVTGPCNTNTIKKRGRPRKSAAADNGTVNHLA